MCEYVYVYVRVFIHVCVLAFVYVWIYVCICVYVYVCVCAYVRVCVYSSFKNTELYYERTHAFTRKIIYILKVYKILLNLSWTRNIKM